MALEIDIEKCKGCGLCVDACPNGVLRMSAEINRDGYYKVVVENSEKDCTGCGNCYIVCPDVCIEIS